MQPIATFSIVAYDPGRQEWGVAVQSKFLGCAAVVSWARAGAGAVATQSYANVRYGIDGLDMLAEGMAAEEVIHTLTTADENQGQRQVGMVDKQGRAASFRMYFSVPPFSRSAGGMVRTKSITSTSRNG